MMMSAVARHVWRTLMDWVVVLQLWWVDDTDMAVFAELTGPAHWGRVPGCEAAGCVAPATLLVRVHDCLVTAGQVVWLYCKACLERARRIVRDTGPLDCPRCPAMLTAGDLAEAVPL